MLTWLNSWGGKKGVGGCQATGSMWQWNWIPRSWAGTEFATNSICKMKQCWHFCLILQLAWILFIFACWLTLPENPALTKWRELLLQCWKDAGFSSGRTYLQQDLFSWESRDRRAQFLCVLEKCHGGKLAQGNLEGKMESFISGGLAWFLFGPIRKKKKFLFGPVTRKGNLLFMYPR